MKKQIITMSHPTLGIVESEGQDMSDIDSSNLKTQEVEITFTDNEGKELKIKRMMSESDFKSLINEFSSK